MVYCGSILADLLTPVSAFMCLADETDRAFLLESVEGGEKMGRYSFIGIDPDCSFEGSFAYFRKNFPKNKKSYPDLPPFTGGAVGVFCYDLVREFERLPSRDGKGEKIGPTGPVLMDFYSTVVVFDHVRHEILVMSHESQRKVDELFEKLKAATVPFLVSGYDKVELDGTYIFPNSNFPSREFESAVERAKEYIAAGDIFQVVLSQRFEVDYTGNLFNVYRALRFVNPSPYMFFLKHGDFCITGSSPEMLVRVQGDNIQYRPIAGTRRRGKQRTEERKLERELMRDEKERAEHLMLVDLGRNDLGRVSRYGSVKVDGLMFLEKYSHVMHLVSSLSGRLRPELNRFDVLEACFPAGTVTGAPKVRAMEIIEELEPSHRGIYAGAVGYLDYSGNLDTCITIRTLVISHGKAYIQAGAGIVADSVPELENKECRNKALALLKALQLAEALSA